MLRGKVRFAHGGRAKGASSPFKPPLKGEVPAKRAEGFRLPVSEGFHSPTLHGRGGGGISSVMRVAHDSSFCGRSLGDFASADANKGLCDRPLETFARSPLQLCGSQRWQVAAALSAAVTSTNSQETAPTLRRNQASRINHPERQPLFGREREGGAPFPRAARSRRLCQPP